ncbi:TlpA family protein disulfide reductase [Amycolatopsis sp. NPDC059657]|uniref:TlpA family protein disulfide reductase n=1 Tax=Amycolatopsis sp. NPDC059657 TaxID=3346899 RepID=UPI00366B1273
MTFLVAAVVFVGALCLFNLLLTFAVLRRLREQGDELAALKAKHGPRYDPEVMVGQEIPVVGHDLVGFFDSGCPTCHEEAPLFAELAVRHSALAVISGAPKDVTDLIELLSPVASLVLGDEATELTKAVDIQAFPTFLQVSGSRIEQAQTSVAALAEKVPSA